MRAPAFPAFAVLTASSLVVEHPNMIDRIESIEIFIRRNLSLRYFSIFIRNER